MGGGGDSENAGVSRMLFDGFNLEGKNILGEAFAFRQGDNFGLFGEVAVFFQLGSNRFVGLAGVVVINVDEVENDSGTGNVAEKIVAEALSLARAFDEAGMSAIKSSWSSTFATPSIGTRVVKG